MMEMQYAVLYVVLYDGVLYDGDGVLYDGDHMSYMMEIIEVVVVFIDKQQDKSSWTPSYSQPPEIICVI